MRAIILLSLRDLRRQWGLGVIMALLLGVTFASYLTLIIYEQSEDQNYANLQNNWLVVGSRDGLGEIYGSRIPLAIGQQLSTLGYNDPIAEVREITGNTVNNIVMIRGMELNRYQEVTPFKLISGRSLQMNDGPRLAMIGTTLARRKELKVGDTIILRGRNFEVVGIFETGAMEDNQAWISLAAAQNLLGYGSDVSVYFVPTGGLLRVGDTLADEVLVSQKGENGRLFDRSLQAFFRFMGLVALLAGLASVITLINFLWRLAYLHQHEFGILKTLGFNRSAFFVYFGTQSGVILAIGLLIGLSLSIGVLFTRLKGLSVFGYGLALSWNLQTLWIMLGIVLAVFAIGLISPLISIHRTPIPNLLGRN